MWLTGSETRRGILAAGFLLMTLTLFPQESILERKLRLPDNSYRAVRALNEVSRLTGYVFTYDTQILNPDRSFTIPSNEILLYQLLDSVTGDSTVKYSVIGKHIILYRESPTVVQAQSGTQAMPLNDADRQGNRHRNRRTPSVCNNWNKPQGQRNRHKQ